MSDRRGFGRRLADLIFVRGHHVCPWWFCHAFDNPLRKLFQDPDAIVAPLVHPGERILDIGAGMGYFTIPLARAAGEKGRVVALDLQRQMLDRIERRAVSAGVRDRIETVLGDGESLGVSGSFDFALAIWMLHEVPNRHALLAGIASILKPGGHLLIAEPKLHVSAEAFEKTIAEALEEGFVVHSRPTVGLSLAVLLQRS
jgi:ubiquinone/menaquinone biosynthesis C-methylase UbiE